MHPWKSFFILFHTPSTDDQLHNAWQLPSECHSKTLTLFRKYQNRSVWSYLISRIAHGELFSLHSPQRRMEKNRISSQHDCNPGDQVSCQKEECQNHDWLLNQDHQKKLQASINLIVLRMKNTFCPIPYCPQERIRIDNHVIDKIILYWRREVILCTVGCLAGSLASTG